jgi:hypothetical protein
MIHTPISQEEKQNAIELLRALDDSKTKTNETTAKVEKLESNSIAA